MKFSNQITLVCRSVGLPESEMVTSGQVVECMKALMIWLRGTRMPNRVEIGIGRNESDAREVFAKGKPVTQAQQSFDELMAESGFMDLLMDDESDDQTDEVTVSPEANQPTEQSFAGLKVEIDSKMPENRIDFRVGGRTVGRIENLEH